MDAAAAFLQQNAPAGPPERFGFTGGLWIKKLKQAHSKDQGNAAADDAASLKEYIETISGTEGSDFQKWIMIFCKQIHLPYNKLTDTEKHWLIQISRKSGLLKSGTNQRGKYQRKR